MLPPGFDFEEVSEMALASALVSVHSRGSSCGLSKYHDSRMIFKLSSRLLLENEVSHAKGVALLFGASRIAQYDVNSRHYSLSMILSFNAFSCRWQRKKIQSGQIRKEKW